MSFIGHKQFGERIDYKWEGEETTSRLITQFKRLTKTDAYYYMNLLACYEWAVRVTNKKDYKCKGDETTSRLITQFNMTHQTDAYYTWIRLLTMPKLIQRISQALIGKQKKMNDWTKDLPVLQEKTVPIKEANNRWRWRQKALAVDPFRFRWKGMAAFNRATIATFVPAPSFDMRKTKRIACSGKSEDGKNLIWHSNDRRCCRRISEDTTSIIFARTESLKGC